MSDIEQPPVRQPVVDGSNAPMSIWWLRWFNEVFRRANSIVKYGSGSPEGVITSSPGGLYCDTDGGAGVTLYVKESGNSNTGWVAK